MEQLAAMRVYLRVAELASFTQAAEQLGLPKASISAAVQQLENQLGARLLHRTTRRVQMTQDGQAYYERCRDLLADMDELQAMFQAGEGDLAGRLRVDLPAASARMYVLPRLPEFLAAHPRIELELSSTDRRVDLVREGFDCVMRVGALVDSSLIARRLGRFQMVNCASREYVARYGLPGTLADLAQHRLVHYAATLGAKAAGFEYVTPDGVAFLAMAGVITVNNSEAYQAASRAGLGIIQLPRVGVADALASGELVELLPDWRAEPMPVSLLYANRRHLPRRVQAFMAWLAQVMAPYLQPDDDHAASG
ncbi:MAG TPA: LysR family transcriptional regulator [Chitinolyticbacter sp.]|nr:LysR family transcriptional regulator [Chitinolyticbacter sp.]